MDYAKIGTTFAFQRWVRSFAGAVVVAVVFFGWNRHHLFCVPISIWRWKWDFWCAAIVIAVAVTWQNCKLSQNATKDDFINRPRRSTEPVRRDSFEIYQEILFVHICANRKQVMNFTQLAAFRFCFLAFFLRFPVREFPISVRCALNLFLKVRSPGLFVRNWLSHAAKFAVTSSCHRHHHLLLISQIWRCGKRQCGKRRPY